MHPSTTTRPVPSRRPAFLAALLAAAAVAAGCSSHEAVPRTGFIPLSVPLASSKSDPMTSVWHDSAALSGTPRKVAIVQVEVGSLADEQMTEEQEAEIKLRMRRALETAFGDRIVQSAGPGVIEVRACLTDFKPNQPLRNLAPQTQILRRGYGFAACEMEATLDGRPVAAMASTVDTQRFGAEKLSETGTADAACATWAERFLKLVAGK